LFAIFNMIGSPSEQDYQDYSRRVPFDPKLFNDFPVVRREKEDFAKQFVHFNDHENLLDLLYKMFEYLPHKRITATDALNHKFFDEIRGDYGELIQRVHRRNV
jgi:serine/threonine protein kinase